MDFALPLDIDSVKGFLSPVEGAALYRAARECAPLGPCLEIGSYCGKSTVYLGAACQRLNSLCIIRRKTSFSSVVCAGFIITRLNHVGP